MNITAKIDTPRLDALRSALGPHGRKALNSGAAESLWAACRSHLRSYALSHHGSAMRLGARPTGHLEQAAASSVWSADDASGRVEISAPGIGRVFRALEIVPKRARALTIPVHALAYGRRVAEVSRSHEVFRPKRKGGKPANYLAAVIDGRLTPLYVLVRRASVPQERSMLPADDALGKAAASGMLGVIRRAMERKAS